MQKTRYRNARVYQLLRSAHLERAQLLEPASILFTNQRYDYDASLAEGLDLVQAGTWRAPLILLTSPTDACEICEPLFRPRLVRTILSIIAVRGRARLGRRRTSIVTYAIENLDPYRSREFLQDSGSSEAGVRRRVMAAKSVARRRLDQMMSRWVARHVDRIVFGTPGAEDLYQSALGPRLTDAKRTSIPALPAPCDCAHVDRQVDQVLFLGAFVERKGFDRLIDAWAGVRDVYPTAQLTIIGKGALEPLARSLVAQHPEVRIFIDPPRAEIHQALRRAAVLVLLSQRGTNWREQVGLPIVEGLAHGCSVVTTTETGLASWLAEHAHAVLPPDSPTSAISEAIATSLITARAASSVTADLPAVDGRLAADKWLFGPSSSEGRPTAGPWSSVNR